MKNLRLLAACFFHLIIRSRCLDSNSLFTAEGCRCVSSYWATVTCVLNITHHHDGESDFTLMFSSGSWNKSCPLLPGNQGFHSDCHLLDSDNFIYEDFYDIDLCCNSVCASVAKEFQPSQNLQLTPPYKVQVRHTPHNITLTWKSGYEGHRYLSSYLHYEVQIQRSSSSGNMTKIITPNYAEAKRRRVSLELPDPETDGRCCVKVRSTTRVEDYRATWSQWSPEVCKGIHGRPVQEGRLGFLGIIAAFLGCGLIVFSCSAIKKMSVSWERIPSPAPYFDPLFKNHGGDLLEWLTSYQDGVTAKTNEEMVIISTVIVEPQAITREQLLLNSSAPFTREASSLKSCVLNMSYTLPPSGSGQFGDDKGPSSQDLVVKPRGSGEPPEVAGSSPADHRHFPCLYTDYFTLNQTGTGMIPVLTSKD